MKLNMKIRLKDLRKQHNWTQDELAERLGASKTHVSEMESGKKNPSSPMLDRIASVFGVSISELLMSDENGVADLIRDYEGLSAQDQAAIRHLAHQLSSREGA